MFLRASPYLARLKGARPEAGNLSRMLSWIVAVAFGAPPTPPPDVPPVFRTPTATMVPALATVKPSATPTATRTPVPIRTPGVWRFGIPSPSPTPSPSRTPVRPTPPPRVRASSSAHDPVSYFTRSIWSCETIAGTPEEHQYVAIGTGFDLHNIFETKSSSVRLDEHYRLTPRTERWSVTLANGAYTAEAGPWSGPYWVFVGTTLTDKSRFSVRMLYHYFDDSAFRRDFQVSRGDSWTTYAAETCTRQPRSG